MRISLRTVIQAGVVGVTFSAAQGSWTVTVLHPGGASGSAAFGAGAAQQVGQARVAGVDRASLWSSTAASWVDLHPPGATDSIALGTDGFNQVGSAVMGGIVQASLWSGSAALWVNLHPANASESVAVAAWAGAQGGHATIAGVTRAGLWSGTAASWADLHPAGAASSSIRAMHAGQQGGIAVVTVTGGPFGPVDQAHASIWSGDAASWVDLHPAGASASWVNGVHAGMQAGVVRRAFDGFGLTSHAFLWNGSADSAIDLHPAGFAASEALALHSGFQAGHVLEGGNARAAMWAGSAASFENLHDALGPGYATSRATGIWTDSESIFIVGWAFNSLESRQEAVLWVRPIPAPATTAALAMGLATLAQRRRTSRPVR